MPRVKERKSRRVPTDEEALDLINSIRRSNVFPPNLKDPEHYLPKTPKVKKKGMHRTPRPPNGFFICRKNLIAEAQRIGKLDMRLITKATSILWQSADEEDREVYQNLAKIVSELHQERNPEFVYGSTKPQEIVFKECRFDSPRNKPTIGTASRADNLTTNSTRNDIANSFPELITPTPTSGDMPSLINNPMQNSSISRFQISGALSSNFQDLTAGYLTSSAISGMPNISSDTERFLLTNGDNTTLPPFPYFDCNAFEAAASSSTTHFRQQVEFHGRDNDRFPFQNRGGEQDDNSFFEYNNNSNISYF